MWEQREVHFLEEVNIVEPSRFCARLEADSFLKDTPHRHSWTIRQVKNCKWFNILCLIGKVWFLTTSSTWSRCDTFSFRGINLQSVTKTWSIQKLFVKKLHKKLLRWRSFIFLKKINLIWKSSNTASCTDQHQSSLQRCVYSWLHLSGNSCNGLEYITFLQTCKRCSYDAHGLRCASG